MAMVNYHIIVDGHDGDDGDDDDDDDDEFLQSLLDRQSPIEGVKVLNHNWEQVVVIIIIIMIMITMIAMVIGIIKVPL